MSRNAILFYEGSTMRLVVTLTDENDAGLDGATVTTRIQKGGTDLDTTGMAIPLSWPVAMSPSGVAGEYEYIFASDLPISRNDFLKANTIATKGGSVRYAEGVIRVVVDEH
jgi:hypothetical protein